MTVQMLKGKIHRATVKQAELNYVGSITVDADLLDAAGIYEYEKVAIVDIENGNRFETYTCLLYTSTAPCSITCARLLRMSGASACSASVWENPQPPSNSALRCTSAVSYTHLSAAHCRPSAAPAAG